MVVKSAGHVTSTRLAHFQKAFVWMISMPSGITREVSPDCSKAKYPISLRSTGRSIEVRAVQFLKAFPRIHVSPCGNMMEARLVQPSKADSPITVSPVKYCSSSNEVIPVFPLNVSPRSVTAAASASLSSPSPLVSQLTTQRAFTLASAKEIFSTMPPLKTSSVHPAAM